MNRRTLTLVSAMVLVLSLVQLTVPAVVPSVSAATPVSTVDANIDCSALGTAAAPNTVAAANGVKAPFGNAGTYPLPSSGGGTATIDPNNSKVFTWSSDYPVDAIIVFGGASANIYRYNNSLGDSTGLTTPTKKNSVPDISHVWFCHDGLVPVTATVGATSVAGARGVQVADVGPSVINGNDTTILEAVSKVLAGTGPFRGSGSLSFRGSGSLSFRGSGSLSFRGSGSLSFRGSGNLGFRGSGSLSFRGSGAFRGSDLVRAAGNLAFRGSGSLSFRGSTVDGAVLQTPLSALELNILDNALQPVLDETGTPITWERILRGTAFQDWPLQSVTFLDVVQLLQAATDTDGDGLLNPRGLQYVADASIFDLDSTGVMLSRVSLLSLLLIDTPLNALSAAAVGDPLTWCTDTSPYTGGTCLIGTSDTSISPDATLFELAMYGVPGTIVPADRILMAPLAAALAGTNNPLALALKGDYDGDGVRDDTDGDGVGDAPMVCSAVVTLGECLVELITPRDFPWEDLPIESLSLDRFALGERLPITTRFSVAPSGSTVRITLPAGFVYDAAAGTTVCQFGVCTRTAPSAVSTTEPQVLTFGPAGLAPGLTELQLRAAPKGLVGAQPGQIARALGSAGPVTVDVTSGSQVTRATTPSVTVTDPWVGAQTAVPDTIYFGSLAAGEIDPFEIRLPTELAGSTLAVRVRSLTASLDSDLALLSPTLAPSMSGTSITKTATALGVSGEPIDDSGTGATDLPPETLQDVPTNPADPAYKVLKDVGANRGRTDETSAVAEATTTGDSRYLVQVSAFNGSSGNYALRVIATPSGIAACPTVTFHGTIGQPLPVTFDQPTSPSGLIVYNAAATSSTLLGANGDVGVPTLYGLARSTHSWLLPVVPAADQSWTSAAQTAGLDCTPAVANATVQAIASKVRQLATGTTAAMPLLDTVVLVGADDRLPLYRNPDTTSIFNEDQNVDSVGTDNPISHSQGNRYFLTDDPYGTLDPIPWLDRSFNIPALAVGRLVESDEDIRGQIAQYLTSNGELTPSTAYVMGYDFLADGAEQIATTLDDAGKAVTTQIDQPGQTPTGTAESVRVALANDPDMASLNAHFSQYELLSSVGDATRTYDVLDTTQVDAFPDNVLNGSVLFSAGCHSGLSVPDVYADVTKYPLLRGETAGVGADWAQTFAGQRSAVWVANTGYGYGAVGSVGLTERLMALYAQRLTDPSVASAGQALMLAKQDYFASQGVYGSYDEKALQQVVFYGIPNFRLGAGAPSTTLRTATDAAPFVADSLEIVAGVDGLPAAASVPRQSFGLQQTTVNGRTSWSANGETLDINGYPVVPRTSIDVTDPSGTYRARGAIIESINTTLEDGVTPRIARAISDSAVDEPAIQPATVVFPTAFQAISGTSNQQRLVVYPGQFSDTDDSSLPGKDVGTQLLMNEAGFTVYYADAARAGDVTRPLIEQSSAAVAQVNGADGVVLFRVKVSDPAGVHDTGAPTGTQRVLIQYDATPDAFDTPHDWIPVELHQELPSGLWVGALVTADTGGKYIVQAVDGAGNVAYSAFKGERYQADGTSPNAVAVVTAGTEGLGGWYTSAVQVSLYIGGRPAVATDLYSYRLSPTSAPIPYTAPFDVPDGANNITFIPPAGAAVPPTITVKKDIGLPTATLYRDNGANPPESAAIEVITAGTDLPAATCVATDVPGGSGPAGCELQASTDVTVDGFTYHLANGIATDVAGNPSPVASQTAVIIDGTKIDDTTYNAANRVTVVAGGTLYQQVTFQVGSNGGPLTEVAGVVDDAALTKRLPTFEDPGTYNIRVTVPGSGANAEFTLAFTVVVDDTIPPTFTVIAPSAPIEATSAAGATATFQVTATDDTDLVAPDVSCTPASGTTFAIGTTTVLCTAADTAGNSNLTSFDITVVDTTAPALTVPADFTAEATGPGGAIVGYTATATDAVAGTVAPQCSPVAGSGFPLGSTTVTCTASDGTNTSAPQTFVVTVTDSSAPQMTTPAPITYEANTRGGAFVPFTPPIALDTVSGSITSVCTPSSGSKFLLGVNSVPCTATDAAGNHTTVTLSITVRDTTPPVLTPPTADMKAKGTSSAGALVNYTVTAVDVDDVSIPTLTCSPASGTQFAYGATTVTCTATDGSGNVTTGSFRVIVVVQYNYNGFFSPVNMGVLPTADGLSGVVNSVNGGRNVPFKWEVFDSVTLARMTNSTFVKIDIYKYADFVAKFGPMLPGSTVPLPANGCAGKTVVPLTNSTTGKTTAVKLTNGQFNVGLQRPAKPTVTLPNVGNCWVAWTSYGAQNVNLPAGGTPAAPGIAALFTMT
ncbi:MAG: HYR domain-containing protein [Actinobacteria bacterium]|nr:HYR domain-containing protein [Actinomycetota bacterium]